jgi:hypothetical protein
VELQKNGEFGLIAKINKISVPLCPAYSGRRVEVDSTLGLRVGGDSFSLSPPSINLSGGKPIAVNLSGIAAMAANPPLSSFFWRRNKVFGD